jgi:Reverse transcriptase (RNA-dependent DNA polymerase)
VTVADILSILSSSANSSCGLDPIPTFLVRRMAIYFAPIISNLCNLSLTTGVFPHSLKRAIVTPRLKKPTLNNGVLASYRPITNLSFLPKVIEQVVAKQFRSHLSASYLLPPNQSAYCPFHSMKTTVLCVHDDLVHAIDNSHVSALLFLDLSSAFDIVDHAVLLSALSKRFSVCDKALNWFHPYLSDLSQSFHLAGNQTACFPVDCSVPQG